MYYVNSRGEVSDFLTRKTMADLHWMQLTLMVLSATMFVITMIQLMYDGIVWTLAQLVLASIGWALWIGL